MNIFVYIKKTRDSSLWLYNLLAFSSIEACFSTVLLGQNGISLGVFRGQIAIPLHNYMIFSFMSAM